MPRVAKAATRVSMLPMWQLTAMSERPSAAVRSYSARNES